MLKENLISEFKIVLFFDITIPRNEKLGFLENCPYTSEIEPLDNKFLEKILSSVEVNPHEKLSFEQRKTCIYNETNLNVHMNTKKILITSD